MISKLSALKSSFTEFEVQCSIVKATFRKENKNSDSSPIAHFVEYKDGDQY
jgi:hypothetical protein